MCGIVADLRGPIPEAARRIIDRRGTRSSQVGPIYHRRLPIVGLDASNDQPMRRGNWIVAFVGEVLDFRERDRGYECDAELVADLWNDVGPHALADRDGFWHVVAYDGSSHLLHLMCDYLAQKPLYYRTDFGACASEPVACARLDHADPDEVYLSAVMKWGYCPEPWRTPFKQVRRVLPGQHVVLNERGQMHQDIVDPLVPLYIPPSEIKVEIEAAVRRRVESSDVPVACLLSGGLDSSIVYTLARRYGRVHPYYVAGDEDDLFEESMVRLVAQDPVDKVRWTDVEVTDAVGIMQEPIDLGSLVPQCALSGVVSEAVCLTGDGADELFGGYSRAQDYDSQQSDIFHELVCWHLPRLDRVMMNNLTEVRSPFLARRVVQAALGLPRELRINKSILRDLFMEDLPAEVLYQKKKPLRTDASRRNPVDLVNKFRNMYWGML